MGTNYYMERGVCPHCDKSEFEFHIGKSSMGWAFTLHVYPGGDSGWADSPETKGFPPRTWEEWKTELMVPGTRVVNEYGDCVAFDEFVETVEARGTSFRRHDIGQFCLSHGEGSWDNCTGVFS
jgi:hypothetical protein